MEILRVNIKSLKLFFLWPMDNMSWVTNIILSMIHQTYIFLTSIPTFAAVGYQFSVGIEDMNILAESVIACCNYVGFVFICICFHINLPKIKGTIERTSNFLEFCDKSVVEAAEKKVRFITIGLMIYFFFGLTTNGILPLLDYKNCNERRLSDYYRLHDPCGMPTRAMNPYEVNTRARFYFVLFLQHNTCSQIAFIVLSITMILIGFLIHITAQIENLRRHLLDTFSIKGSESNPEKLLVDMEKKLKFCIRYHNTIIEYTREVFEAYNITLVLHVCFTSAIWAIIGYQILSVDSLMDKSRYTLHLMGWVGMLFLTCYYGQKILDESTTIGDAAYQSEWYNGPLHLKKMICLIILRSQRPLLLTVASIGVVSLATFVSIIKTAYSYFALLITIAE
nr:odorant receptor 5 [Monochamus saltuarius]